MPPHTQSPPEAKRTESGDTGLCPLASAEIWPSGFCLPAGRSNPTRKRRSQTPERGRKDSSVGLHPVNQRAPRDSPQAPPGPLHSHSHPSGPSTTRSPFPPNDPQLLSEPQMEMPREGQEGSEGSWNHGAGGGQTPHSSPRVGRPGRGGSSSRGTL